MIKIKFYNQEYNNALVSIIMPAYNSEHHIEEAIESVICQTYREWELLVIDDGSTDSTAALVGAIAKKDSRISLVRFKINQGVAAARNKGLELARGRYIAFLDSDDLWLPEKLEKQIAFMDDNGYSFTFHSYRHFKDANVSKKVVKVPKVLSYDDELRGNYIGCLTVCLDRSGLKSFSMPNERHEDYITWLNILKDNHICAYGMQEDLARYRIGNSSTISSNKLKSAWWTWLVIRGQGISVWKACWCMVGYLKKNLIKWC